MCRLLREQARAEAGGKAGNTPAGPAPAQGRRWLLAHTGAELGLQGQEGQKARPRAGAALAGGCSPAAAQSWHVGKL